MSAILNELQTLIEERKSASPDSSYVASLHAKGLDKILEKVGEESTETIIAAKNLSNDPDARSALISEVADLWFHCVVMLSHLDCDQQEVLDVLAARFGVSGLEEKASRNCHNSVSFDGQN